ncbi:MAG TPA: DUF1937 family protein [Sedimentisphaerales bacterium]|nr:DUF1937 family protein [Sedimentisphaerales bacterium]
MDGITYLACPYSHTSATRRATRFAAANRAAGYLMRRGEFVFSPISHTHPIALACDLPLGFDYWEAFDRAILAHCSRIVVLAIPGWTSSTGVKAEIEIAKEMSLPIEYLYPDTIEKEEKP